MRWKNCRKECSQRNENKKPLVLKLEKGSEAFFPESCDGCWDACLFF
jgi:hypothetical protein